VHRLDIFDRRGQSGADRPDRLISYDQFHVLGIVRQRTRQLGRDHGDGLTGFPFFAGFTDTDDRGQAGTDGGFGLRLHRSITLTMIRAALRMAQDDIARPGITQHVRGQIAGMGTALERVTVLPAHGDGGPVAGFCSQRQQGCRGTDQNLAGRVARNAGNLAKEGQIACQAVHFPVSGNQCSAWHIPSLMPQTIPVSSARISRDRRREQESRCDIAVRPRPMLASLNPRRYLPRTIIHKAP